MNRSLEFIAVLLAAVVIALAVYLVWKKRDAGTQGFDERQLPLRAQGYRKSFFVTLVAEVAALLLVEMEIIPLACATLAFFIAVMIGIVTFAVFCIMKDVFFRIGEKGTYYLVLCAAVAVMDGIMAITRFADGSILENGLPTFESCNSLVVALSFIVIFAALLARRIRGEEAE